MKKVLSLLAMILLAALFAYCSKDTTPVEPTDIDYTTVTNISYSEHVQVILNEYKDILTAANIYPEGLQMDSWANLIKGWQRGEAFIPFDSGNSLLIELATKLDYQNKLRDDKIDLLQRWVNQGAKNDNGEIPYQTSVNRLYVCNQDEGMVSVIDTDAKVVIRNIKLQEYGFSASPKPHDIAVEPGGQHWYVSLIGDGKVAKFDRDYNLVGQADFEAAGLLAMHPTKDLLYVGHTLSIPSVPQTLGVITRSTMNLEPIALPFSRPHALISDHAGNYIFAASLVESRFAVIDTRLNPAEIDFLANIGGLHTLVHMNVSPDDQTIYISSQLTGQLLILDASDPSALKVMDSVSVGAAPWHPKYTPDGSRVYVGNNSGHTVSVVNTATRMEETKIGAGDGSDGLAEPHGLVISPNGQYVYVTNRNRNPVPEYTPRYDFGDNANSGTVVVINTATNSIEKVIEIEKYPSGLAIYEQ